MKKRFLALALAVALCAGLCVLPASAGEEDILWLPEEVVFPTEVGVCYVPELNWLSASRDEWGKEPCVYDLSTGTFVEEYDTVLGFSEGLSVVAKDGRWGYIDRSGKVAIPLVLSSASSFQDGVATVLLEMEYRGQKYLSHYLMDKTGKLLASLDAYTYGVNFSEGLAAVLQDGLCGYIDTTGQVVIPFQFDTAGEFFGGLAAVTVDGKLGYIDKSGEFVIQPQFDYEYYDARYGLNGFYDIDFSQGLAVVEKDGQAGYIDQTGEMVITLESGMVGNHFSGGLASVEKDGKQGFIDKTGQVAIPLTYDSVWSFNGGLAVAWKDGKAGLIDKTGREVVPCRYDYAGEVDGADLKVGRYYYVQKDGRTGLVENPEWTAPVEVQGTACPSNQTVTVDGVPVEFRMYALKDEKGNLTNYVKLRDLAVVLNGTDAQFAVGWDGSVTITTHQGYTPNGTEGNTPFSGERAYAKLTAATIVDDAPVSLDGIRLQDDAGGGYTYFQLRDLGKTLGFNVGWSGGKGVFIETNKPYDPAN